MNIILKRKKIEINTDLSQPQASEYPVGTIGYFERGALESRMRIVKRSSRFKHYWATYYGAVPKEIQAFKLLGAI